MLDIGWSELVLIGVAALIFVGPKDLPRMFFALGKMTAKARGMAREFQRAMDDAAKTSGLDDIKKDINGLKTGVTAVTNPSALGINALEDAARKFEKWDPKTVLKPAAAADAPSVVTAAPSAAQLTPGSAMGAETKALAEKRAAEAAEARAKAHALQAKAAETASATFAARAKADAEAAAAGQAAAQTAVAAADAAPKAARVRKAKPAVAPDPMADLVADSAAGGAEAVPSTRKPPVRRKKSEA